MTKVSADNGYEWTKQFGTHDTHDATAVAADTLGGAVVSWCSCYRTNGKGHSRLDRYDGDGLLDWSLTYGSDREAPIISSLEAARTGGFYAGGYIDSGDKRGAYIAYVSRDGVIEWEKHLGENGSEKISSLTETPAGLLAFGGQAGSDFYVGVIEPQGELLWSKRHGDYRDDIATGLAVAADGAIFLGGSTRGYSGTDARIVAFESDGTIRWDRRFGGLSQSIRDVASDGHDGVIVSRTRHRDSLSPWGRRTVYSEVNRLDRDGFLVESVSLSSYYNHSLGRLTIDQSGSIFGLVSFEDTFTRFQGDNRQLQVHRIDGMTVPEPGSVYPLVVGVAAIAAHRRRVPLLANPAV